MNKEELNELSGQVIDAAFEMHRELGPGLLERVYESALEKELINRGIPLIRQFPVSVQYKGQYLDEDGFRIDILVADSVVVEHKTVEELMPIHQAQLHTYMRLSGKVLGLLINFNSVLLKNGIKRHVINFPN